ncbi:MAG: hypothetical protein KIG69_02835 [Eubacteriales bacterium]|nr:hypothetical protein [Eubacteriales bacterium]
MDNEKMNAAIEETLRRVQGFSDAVVGSGDAMDKTTQEIVESINIQKRVINELENTVAELNAKINSVEPGAAQDALIEQANAVRAELEGEKQGMVALINELNNLQRANAGVATTQEEIRAGLGQIGAACEMHETALASLEDEYAKISAQMNTALKSGNDNEYRALRERALAIKGEITTRKQLLKELRDQSNALEAEATKMEQAAAAAQNTAQSHVSLRSRIRELREEMALYREQFGDQTDKYREMSAELGRLQDIQGDIQAQGSILSNDQAQFQGVISGLNGVVGGFTAAQGAVALFAGENENLQKIMLKVQSLMSITMGLQQVSATLNKDSAFRLATVNSLREWWNKLLAIGRGEQIASTAATIADTTATTASTVATTANTAAQTAANGAKTASIGASTGAAAAQGVQTASAVAGTAANIGLAGAFRMVGAAIKSIPVFGWILAGISALIALVSHFVGKANEAKKAAEEWYNAIAENSYKPIAAIMDLSARWNALGNDLEAKKQFIEDNKKAFDELGASVNDVVDAENLLVKNKDAFINAQIEKAKATIYLQQATEKVKELIKKEQEVAAMPEKSSTYVQTSSYGTGYWVEGINQAKVEAKKELADLRAEITQGFTNAAKAEKRGFNILKNAGVSATQTYAKGSLGAIQQAIALKQEALKKLTNNADYQKAMKEIEALQKQADKITGKTTTTSGGGGGGRRSSGGGGTKKDPFLEKLAKYKSEYARFQKWVNSGDAIIQKAAATEFDGLLKQGATYIDYLKRQRDIILDVDVANRTKAQNKQLRQLNDAIAEETKNTVLEAFNNELSASLANAKTVLEMLKVIEAKRKELSGDGTELDNAKAKSLDNAEEKANAEAAKQTEALLTEYASFTEQKRRLDEQYRIDKELLDRRLAKATSAAEIAEIKNVMAEREKKYNKDVLNVGGYDEILNQYGGYEQKKTRIQEQYAERRRIAELNGNTQLLQQLATAEQNELSKLQSDLIKNSADWQNLFGNLDELTTSTIKKLIAKIEGKKATIGVDLNPQDLKALTDQLNKAREEVEKRNPFTALGAAWKRLKEATKDGKGLGSDEAKKATKDVASAVSQSINLVSGTFNAVTAGLQKMGVSMDEETQAILSDLGGIMDGASQVAQGIATGNPLSVIQGSIGLLSSAFDLFNSRDRKAEKQIKKHQEAINKLQNAYKQLEWQIDKALGGEVYKNQRAAIKNMQEQQAHLKASWEAEISKKHTDWGRVDDFKEQYAELGRQIEDLIDEISNDLLQTNAKDFANELGDALVEAFGKGEDAAKAMETTVNSVLKNLVFNQLKKNFLETQLQGALDQLEKDMGYWSGDNFIFDGLSDEEIARFKASVGAATANFNNAMQLYEDLFKEMGLDDTDESLTGAVKGVSEETADILAGQMNAIRINQLDMAAIMRQQLQQLNQIAVNTGYNKYLSRIERIITILEQNQSGNTLRSQGLS